MKKANPGHPRRRRKNERTADHRPSFIHSSGFTLLELLISLTIVGVILVIIFGALRIGTRAWEKGEADVEAQQREMVVLSLVKRQISSFCAREIAHEDKDPYLFKGDERSMSFISRLAAVPAARSGMVYVKYIINSAGDGEDALALYEQDVVSAASKGILEEDLDESAFHTLIPGAHYIGFDYLKRPEEGNMSVEWQEVWDPDSDEGFPMAVRLTFKRDKDAMPLRVIARIHPEGAKDGLRE
jgi:general secretion pathway protein J